MGDRLRRYFRQVGISCRKAAFPAILLTIGMMVACSIRQIELTPYHYILCLLFCYALSCIMTLIRDHTILMESIHRIHAELIGNTFGGFRRCDRIFSKAMQCYYAHQYRDALEYYLVIREESLTERENAVCSYYIGRCYHHMGCAGHARQYYETALAQGFDRNHALLFLARSSAECGDLDAAMTYYQPLLDEPPIAFPFLYTDVGFAYLRQKHPNEAMHWFQISIEKGANYAMALGGMAVACLYLRKTEESRVYYHKALLFHIEEAAYFKRFYADIYYETQGEVFTPGLPKEAAEHKE